jgi:hypothetical protein
MVTPNFSSYPALLFIAVNLSLAGQTSLANEGEPVVREHRESLFNTGKATNLVNGWPLGYAKKSTCADAELATDSSPTLCIGAELYGAYQKQCKNKRGQSKFINLKSGFKFTLTPFIVVACFREFLLHSEEYQQSPVS